jgi:hypothetical protein
MATCPNALQMLIITPLSLYLYEVLIIDYANISAAQMPCKQDKSSKWGVVAIIQDIGLAVSLELYEIHGGWS